LGEIFLDFYIKKLKGKRKKEKEKRKLTNQPTNPVCMCINMLKED
jgi:hypothetical protein